MNSNDSNIFRDIRADSAQEFIEKASKNVNVLGLNNESLLQEAIAIPRYDLVMPLIELGINVNIQDNAGKTALHYAIDSLRGKGERESVEDFVLKLLENGANPNIADKYGNAPIWTASLLPKKSYRIIEALLTFGADPNMKNSSGKSAIDFASQTSNEPLLEALSARNS